MKRYRTWTYGSVTIIASKDAKVSEALLRTDKWSKIDTNFPFPVFVNRANYKRVSKQVLPAAILKGLAEMLYSD